MRDVAKSESPTLADRLAAALISMLAAAGTLAAFYALMFVLGAAKAASVALPALNAIFFSWVSIALLAFAAVGGFMLGSRGIAVVFAVMWGTARENDPPEVVRAATVIRNVLFAIFFAALALPLFRYL